MNTILVIEDETILREIISEMLTNLHFHVLQASDGQQGLEMAQAQQPDLILCDIMMPGLDGYCVLQELRQAVATAAIPFIFLTAKADKPAVRRGMILGADDYLTKPFTHEELLAAIQTRLERQATLAKAFMASEVPAVVSHTSFPTREQLRQALDRQEFIIHYQPQLALRTRQIIGAEALVRWYSPDHGLISPAKFIPLAEQTGLIIPLGNWVLKTVCQQAKAWQTQGFPPIQVAVNLSGAQFERSDLTGIIQGVLQTTGLDPHFLDLELTESLLIQDVKATMTRLKQLKDIGIHISIDDFGTGYASLGYLQHFPFDTLKIDQCFVRDVHLNSKNAAITTALIHMAHGMELQVIAEGVETEAEEQFLLNHQCDAMQGYLFSHPLPAQEFETLLHTYQPVRQILSAKSMRL